MKETYERTGVSFDKYYFESQTYLRGKEEVLKGLDEGIFFKAPDGSVRADLTADGLDQKVLLRKDGTSVYITQDFGTAIMRHEDWPFARLVYVVGSEQNYHFQVLFKLLARLGFDWAKDLYHLSYGMVNLPEGKMKSREGTVVDADDLIDSLRDMALEQINAGKADDDGPRITDPAEAKATAEKIAIGALHYFLLSASPAKDMMFNPKESLSFNGNTGPYLQYVCARLASLLKKADTENDKQPNHFSLLTSHFSLTEQEWELIKALSGRDEALTASALAMDPSILCAWLYEAAKKFSRFYHDVPILKAEPEAREARLALCRKMLAMMQETLKLVCIPFIESM
jgi:arginyl-tRNA synthetase